ncbi:MAG: CapA family protein [Cyanobacteria bacterium J06643_4]
MMSALRTSEESLLLESSPLEVSTYQIDFAGLDIQQLAAEGYFQAIAYWLNELLIPQQVYAQVLAADAPGKLKVLVEFERAPQKQRLMKFICARLYKLNSNVIEGVHLIVRALGSGTTDWEKRIRIPTALQRQAKAASQRTNKDREAKDKKAKKAAKSPQLPFQKAPAQTLLAQTLPAQALPTQTLPAQASIAAEDTDKHEPAIAPTASTEKAPQPANQTLKSTPPLAPTLVHESPPSAVARAVVRNQFKFFRMALMSGAAAAAFLFGGLAELVLSERLTASTSTPQPEVAVPWYEQNPVATEVAFQPGNRFTGRTVEAALETVAVIPHRDVPQPEDPTITLLFGGELGLNDFVFDEAESLDELFADLTIYQEADVAMVGLSEPLATPSTSLQENFYHRTRPQAVQALKKGGIDIVSLASEGTLRYGSEGLSETLRTLDRQGIYRVGAGRDQQEAHRPEILDVKGQRIAYLGYNPEALKAAKENKAGVARTNSKEREHILEDIRAIRSQVDWIVVNYRWGDILGESSDRAVGTSTLAAVPEEWQQALARDAVDAGADLVVGYHPSQIQGAEIYRDRAIAYSLGDFVFGEAPLEDHETAALRVSLRNQQMRVEFLPVSIRDSQIEMATGEHGTAILQSIRDASKSFDQPLRFPAILQAPPKHTPVPSANSWPTTHEQIPETTEFIEQSIEPIPTEQLPEAFSAEGEEPQVGELQVEEPQVEAPPRYEEPAPNPRLRESDALFMPEEEMPEEEMPQNEIPQNEMPQNEISVDEAPFPADNSEFLADPIPTEIQTEIQIEDEAALERTWPEDWPEGWQEDWQNEQLLENWGENSNAPSQDFVPIPNEPIERHYRGDIPESRLPEKTTPKETALLPALLPE